MEGVVVFLGFMVMIAINALALAIVIDMTSAFHMRSADMLMDTLASTVLPAVCDEPRSLHGEVYDNGVSRND